MLPAVFQHREIFQQTFIQGLQDLLEHAGLGAYILVLANATYDSAIYPLLRERLEQQFHNQADGLTEQLKQGQSLNQAPDDLLVFLKLMAVGFEALQLTEFRQVGPWQVQYNQLRSFRPARMSNAVVHDLYEPFDAQGFHFDKAFLAREILWQGALQGKHCSLFYNKFPFAPLHGLLVVEPGQHHPQFLTEEAFTHIWQLTEQLGNKLSRVGFGYNSRGAYSSVNHLHFQMYVEDDIGYPVEQPQWKHNGGPEDFPLSCERFTSLQQAWRALNQLHESNTAYNLLQRPGVLYLTPRVMQGGYTHADWTGGFAWAEVAGAVTTFRRDDFLQMDELKMTHEMSKLLVP